MILEKERELHEIHDLRVRTLDSALSDKERELSEERRRLGKLREVLPWRPLPWHVTARAVMCCCCFGAARRTSRIT